jgi:hypothetical protein
MGRFQYIKGRSFGTVGGGVSFLFMPPG